MHPSSDPNFMARTEPDPSEVQKLLDQIKSFDCEPAIFKVTLVVNMWSSGYSAVVLFREAPNKKATLHIEAHGETPEEALSYLLETLEKKFSKCPTCGQYQKG